MINWHNLPRTITRILLCGAALTTSACSRKSFTDEREQLRFGLALQPSGALAIIAAEKGFFSDAGLDVAFVEYVSGKRAMQGLSAGEVDALNVAEVPVACESFLSRDFRIAASLGKVHGIHSIVARKDTGITTPADLRGKKIGTQKASAVHFFLHLFLSNHGLSEDDVEIDFMKAEELPRALAEGQIDAFSMREPFVSEAKSLLPGNTIIFGDRGVYTRAEVLVISKDLSESRPSTAEKIVKALIAAQEYCVSDVRSARAIIAARLGAPLSTIEQAWSGLDLRVALDQSLIRSLEDEAEWVLEAGIVEGSSQTEMPNYMDYLHSDALHKLRPDAVTYYH